MRALVAVAIAELVLLNRSGLRWLLATLIAVGALAILQEPAFVRRQGLDAAWSSIAVWMAVLVGGVSPWLWLQAGVRRGTGGWERRAAVSVTTRVVGAWLAILIGGLAVGTASSAALFTLDRILGHGAPPSRAVDAVVGAVGFAAVAGGYAVALRFLETSLPSRAALWIVGVGVAASVVATANWPIAVWAGAILAALMFARALLSRRRAVRH